MSFGAVGATPSVEIPIGVPYLAFLGLEPLVPFPDPDIVVTSSKSEVAIADRTHGTGVSIVGQSLGNATITAKSGSLTAEIKVTVVARPLLSSPMSNPVSDPSTVVAVPATAISLDSVAKTISTVLQFDIGATVTPSNFNEGALTFVSSDSGIACVAATSGIVNRTGIVRTGHVATVRGISPGTATITAAIGSVTATCVVTVI